MTELYKEFIELYDFKFYIMFCDDLIEGVEAAKLMDDYASWFDSKDEALDWLDSSTAVYFTTKKNERILFLPYKVTNDEIAHESFHVAYALAKDRGIGMNDASEEAWAYLIGYIVKRVHERKKEANAERRAKKRAEAGKE